MIMYRSLAFLGALVILQPSGRWSGSFIASTPDRSFDMSVNVRTKLYGSAIITSQEKSDFSKVILSVGGVGASSLGWQVGNGRCGSGDATVLGPNEFPPMDVGASGKAELTREFHFSLDPKNSYHVDLYKSDGPSGSYDRREGIMACANLKYQK
jgi:hypothetical protein